jgi:hypothetical protein
LFETGSRTVSSSHSVWQLFQYWWTNRHSRCNYPFFLGARPILSSCGDGCLMRLQRSGDSEDVTM